MSWITTASTYTQIEKEKKQKTGSTIYPAGPGGTIWQPLLCSALSSASLLSGEGRGCRATASGAQCSCTCIGHSVRENPRCASSCGIYPLILCSKPCRESWHGILEEAGGSVTSLPFSLGKCGQKEGLRPTEENCSEPYSRDTSLCRLGYKQSYICLLAPCHISREVSVKQQTCSLGHGLGKAAHFSLLLRRTKGEVTPLRNTPDGLSEFETTNSRLRTKTFSSIITKNLKAKKALGK